MARKSANLVSPTPLSPQRLTEAADAVYRAAADAVKRRGGPASSPMHLVDTPAESVYLLRFSKDEIWEACNFLVRLGFLKRPGAKCAG